MDESGSISPSELQAELDTLRSLRRRSISQPSDGIDPDLPSSPALRHGGSTSPPTSPTALAGSPFARTDAAAARHPEQQHAPVAGPSRFPGMADTDQAIDEDMPLADNISDLFWLPARLHPEIAPMEFRNFIRDHTAPENLMRRSGSQLGRRKSTLSRQYIPSDSESEGGHSNDSPRVSRAPSRQGSFRRNTGLERLTINDLQRLETLARQAAEEGQEGKEGEAQLKRLVRRSLSLNPAALLGAADQLTDEDQKQPIGDENDSPLIVPPPGSILRRAARTKIRKNSLLGDGNGHRFGPSKRSPRTMAYGGTVEEETDEADISRRTVSVGSVVSLGSYEDDSFEREQPPETRRPPKSPDRPGFSAPIPSQYMAPSSTDVDDASANIRASPERNILSPARAGADVPNAREHTSPPNRAASLPSQALSSPSSPPAIERVKSIDQMRQEAAERLTASMSGLAVTTSTGRSTSPNKDEQMQRLAASPMPAHADPPSSVQQQLRSQYENRPTPPRKMSDDSTPLYQTLQQRQAASSSPTEQSRPPNVQPLSAQNLPRLQPSGPGLQDSRRAAPVPEQVAVPPPVKQVQQQQLLSPPQKEKKSTWARLGLSRSGKDDSNDTDDAASIMSASSNSSGFSMASSGKKGKKGKKDKHEAVDPKRATHPPPIQDKDKDKTEATGGFFGGLFGSKRKSEGPESEKREVQSAHLQLPTPPPTASGMLTADGKYVNFYRLPIHIERAVYRLSHIKLANPRRPLYEQVLISNLMFWYLGVINKPAVPPSQMQQQNQHMRNGQHQQQRPQGMAGQGDIAPPRPSPPVDHSMQMNEGMPSARQTTPLPTTSYAQAAPGYVAPSSDPRLQPYSSPTPPRPSVQITQNEAVFAADTVSSPISTTEGSTWQTASTSASYRNLGEPSFQVNRPQRGASMPTAGQGQSDSSARAAPSKDVHYDVRRKTADLDTYDIISAYADEERRKSGLAAPLDTQPGPVLQVRSPSPNLPASGQRGGSPGYASQGPDTLYPARPKSP